MKMKNWILQGIKNIVHWNELELQLFHMAHSGQEALEMSEKGAS